MKFRRTPILPLSRDAASRFLPWLIAFMVWLATMALAAVLALSTMSEDWRQGLSGTLTIQIIPTGDETPAIMDARVNTALKLMRKTPGIASANPIPHSRVLELLEPWLGRDAMSGALGLPLPRLIDSRLKPHAAIDTGALGAMLSAAVPGATLDDHGLWLERLIELANAVEGIAFAVLALIAIAAIATVVFATRAGLDIHHQVIELLHLIGARDGYISAQFQWQALWLSLKGGIAGLALAAATLAALGTLMARIEAGLLPPLSLNVWQWVALVAVVLCATSISVLTARITVMRAIGRMP
ncbi:MAG: cell division transport system permease protein [Alphaproteobacteria bacterium]|jgi:cell division transport system permease protein